MTEPDRKVWARFFPGALIVLFFAIVALAMTHGFIPLSQLGSRALYGDMLILGYVLAWGSHALSSNPFHYYDPPIFHPLHNMLPGTDGLELPALLLMPVWLLTHNPVLLMNLAIFVSHFFALCAAYVAARLIMKLDRSYCILVAALFAISSDRFWHACGHLNLIWSGVLPLIFAGVWITLEEPRIKRAALLAVAMGLSVYLSVYFFVLGGLTAAIAFMCWCVSRGTVPGRSAFRWLAVAVVAAGLLASPKILVYKQAADQSSDVRNSLAEAASYSATPTGYFKPTSSDQRYTSYWYKFLTMDAEQDDNPEDGQFLGYFLAGLLTVEFIRLAARAVGRKWDKWDRLSFVAMAFGGVLILCSFGPEFTIKSVSPYRILYYTYLQFSGFYRVPARLAFVVEWLAVLPVGVLLLNFGSAVPRPGRWIGVPVVLMVTWFEHGQMKRPAQFSWEKMEIFRVLDEQDPSGKQPYVFISPEMDLTAALSTTENWRPTVNGWIGSPLGEGFDQRAWSFPDFPTSSSLAWLADNGVAWIMTDDPMIQQRAQRDDRLAVVDNRQGTALFSLKDPDSILKNYQQFLDQLRQNLSVSRQSTPDTIAWPADFTFQATGGDGFQMEQDRYFYQTGDRNSLSALFDFSVDVQPGLYDRIEVEYELLEGHSTHQVKVYWETAEQAMSEKRGIGGTASENDDGKWRAVFEMRDHDWYTDDPLRRLRFDFHNFDDLKPVVMEIKQVRLIRAAEIPTIPLM